MMKEPARVSFRRNSLDTQQSVRQNGHVPFSPKPSRKGASLCCTGPRASPDNEVRPPPRSALSDPPIRPPKMTQVSDWPKKDGPLKLSLYNGGGREPSENGPCCGTLPKPVARNNANLADLSYGTLPRNSLNGVGVDVNHFGTLTKVMSARNVNAANTPRDSMTPPILPPRNGLVTFRVYSDTTQQPGLWSPHKLNSDNKVRWHGAFCLVGAVVDGN